MTTTTTINEQFQFLVNGSTHLGASGIAGTNNKIRTAFWEEFRAIYSEKVSIEIGGNKIVLIANHSVSKKSTSYFGSITTDQYKNIIGSDFGLCINTPCISIQNGVVQISNGKNFHETIENNKVTIL